MNKTSIQINYFKRHQRDNIFHYYEVHGGPGKTGGYQVVINLLNDFPIISIEHNNVDDPTGTWCQFEVGIPIPMEEYAEAYEKAVSNPKCQIR